MIWSLLIDNEPYLVGKDEAGVLGYSSPSETIIKHVVSEVLLINQL